jgi:DNA-directed RNA polymerase specialized sigma24 family protein
MNEEGFFGWLFVLTRSQYYSRMRQLNRLRNNGLSHDDTPIENLNIAAPDDGKEGKYFLDRFLNFIRQYPEGRRHVLKLWLQGYSYREIEKKLKGTPFRCSHVTVGNWVMVSLGAFKKSLDEIPELAAHVSGVKASLLGVSHFHQPVADR